MPNESRRAHGDVKSASASDAATADPLALEAVARRVATTATDMVRNRLGTAQVLDTKTTPTDVVTQADLEVDAWIRGELLAATPGAAIKSEEEGSAAGTNSIRWIVDPIDGTVNFLYNLPVMSVSIAAAVGDEVVSGAVADVVRGEVFSGSVGNGVSCDGVTVSPSKIGELAVALIGTGFSYSAAERSREGEVVARVLPATRDIRNFGSAALHLAWVASGRLDAFYQRGLHEWDSAAGAFLAVEAGARVELEGATNGHLLLAAAPGIFDQLRALIVE